MLDSNKIRDDFPILKRRINGKPLIYLDSAASSQKPRQVIDAMKDFYENHYSNVHRGIHKLSEEATELYESSRKKIARFINARENEIIFVRNATEALNLIAYSYGTKLGKGDEVISSVMEHHSNIVPWQSLKNLGVVPKFIDIYDDGYLKMEQYNELVTKKTKIITITHVSNVLGTINKMDEIEKIAHENNALFVLDSAQSIPHMPVDVKKLKCDFLVASGHKMLAPTGIGFLFGRNDILEDMSPFLYGGDMIKEVHLEETTYNDLPWKFEAGTPNIAGSIGLGAAVDYLQNIGMENVREHEKELTQYALKKLQSIEGITMYGPKNAEEKGGVIAFNLGDIHSHDLATLLNEDGIAIRSGHHCAMPLHKRLGITSSARASFYVYNTEQEIDALVESLGKAGKVFRI